VLQNLTVDNIGVIKTASLNLEPGLIAITGETGAGKSMLLNALCLVQGENLAHIQKGGLSVQAVFSGVDDETVQAVNELGGFADADELVISREFDDNSGRFKAIVGGKIASAAWLQQKTTTLIKIHGQSEQLTLKSSRKVRELLDIYADLETELAEYATAYKNYCALKTRLENAQAMTKENAEQAEFLKYAVEKIAQIDPQPHEDEILKAKLNARENIGKIGENLQVAINNLNSENDENINAVNSLTNALNAVEIAENYDSELQNTTEKLKNALLLVDEVKSELHNRLFNLEYNPYEIEEMNQRLGDLGSLTAPWGPTIDDVLAFYHSAVEKLEEFEEAQDLEKMRDETTRAEAKTRELAEAISAKRVQAAQKFSQNVSARLAHLGFKSSLLQVEVAQNAKFDVTGVDEVQILFSAHKSTAPGALSKVASGGELSRIMLAIEIEIAGKTRSQTSASVDTLVFDEVDAGVGGEAALTVADLLEEISRTRQVIVITHLAVIAAKARQHFLLEKFDAGEENTTRIRQIAADERVNEIARMLSGAKTDAALEHARALLSSQ
jgi:DNA repair protein RecN (Recombination protein N)